MAAEAQSGGARPSSDTCSAFVRSISVATPTSLLSAESRTERPAAHRRCRPLAREVVAANVSAIGTGVPRILLLGSPVDGGEMLIAAATRKSEVSSRLGQEFGRVRESD